MKPSSSMRKAASSSASLSTAPAVNSGNSNLFRISITNLRCKYLPAADLNGFSDPYVVFDFDKKKQIKTPIKKKTLNPVWSDYRIDYLFEVTEDLDKKEEQQTNVKGTISIAKRVLESKKLFIDVWDYDLLTKSDYLGSTELDFYSLATGPRHCIFTLMNKKKQKKAGTIEFSIECELLSDISVQLKQVELSNMKPQQQQSDWMLSTHPLISNESSKGHKEEETAGDEMLTNHLSQAKCQVPIVPNEKRMDQDMTLTFCRTSLSDLRRQGLRVDLKKSNMIIASGDLPFKEHTKNYYLLFNPKNYFRVEVPLIHNNGSVTAKLSAKLSFDKLPYISPFVDGARTDSSMCGIPMFIQLPTPTGYHIPESLIEENEQLLKEAEAALAAQEAESAASQQVVEEEEKTIGSTSTEHVQTPSEEVKKPEEEDIPVPPSSVLPEAPQEESATTEEQVVAPTVPAPAAAVVEEPEPAKQPMEPVEPTPAQVVAEPAKPTQVPNDFKCNLTQEIMKDPVHYFGYYLEKKALEDYLKNNSSASGNSSSSSIGTCYIHPITKSNVDKQVFENHYKPLRVDTDKKVQIEKWLRENPQVQVSQFLEDCDSADMKTFEKSFFLRGYNPLATDEHNNKHSYCHVINSFSNDSAAKLKALLNYSMNATACEWVTSHFYSLDHSSNKEHQIQMNTLINCAYNGNVDMLKILVQYLIKYLNYVTSGTLQPQQQQLGAAGVATVHYQLFKVLNQKSTNGYSLLHYAAYRRDVALIDYLMQLKQDIVSKLQAEEEKAKQVQAELFNLCDEDKSGEVTPLFIISSEIQDLEYMKKLFKNLSTPSLTFHTSKNFNLLHYCLLNENESIVKFFLNHLHQLSILETLLNQKTKDSLGYTPFHRLILQLNQKSIDIVLKSIHFDSFINIQSNFNETVLHLLIKNSNFDGKHQDEEESDNEEEGGDGNDGDVEQKQQQVEAYFLKERQESILAIVEQLLAYGIDLTLRNNDNKTALDLARDDNYELIVEAIERNERARRQLPSKLPLLFKEMQELKQENSKLKEQLEEYQKLKQQTSNLMFELKKLTQTVKALESKMIQ